MLNILIALCVFISAALEIASYEAQIAKIRRTGKSKDVSSTFYTRRTFKYFFALVALVLSSNWIGFIIEMVALAECLRTLIIIARHKPDNWTLFN